MERLENGTWVLIADGEKALFLENVTDHENPNFRVRREEHNENPATREQGTDAPGRMPDGMTGRHRSAMEETDWHRLGKERFADDLTDLLDAAVQRGDFSRLVLVAPPRTLGELRAAMPARVAACVVGEIPKELTGHKLDDIERIVKADLEVDDRPPLV